MVPCPSVSLRPQLLLLAIVAAAVLCVSAPAAHAALPADGASITELGGGTGWAYEDLGTATGTSSSVKVLPDGSILTGESVEPIVQGYAQVTRRTPDGALDPTFGVGGHAQVSIGAGATNVYDIDVDSLGRIIAVGSYVQGGATGTNAFVARFLPDGTPDPAFDGDGIFEAELCATRDDAAYAVTVQPDDAVLVGGYARSACAAGSPELAVFRVTTAGALDLTFGVGGIVDAHPTPGTASMVTSITMQADGQILAAGQSMTSTNGFVVRMDANGVYDPTFGTGGVAALPDFTWVSSVISNADGTMFLSGESLASGGSVTRLLADGTPDPTFGTSGLSTTPGDHFFSLGSNLGNLGAAVQPDGSYLLCGSIMDIATIADRYYDLGAVRFTPDGQFDTSFGVGGYAVTHAAGWELGDEAVGDCAMGPDGNLIAAGVTSLGTSGSDYRVPIVTGWHTRTDFTDPVAAVASSGSSTTISFDVTASDTGSGLEDVIGAYSFDGGATWQASPHFEVTGLLPGAVRVLQVVVRDRSGNTSTPQTASGWTTPDSDAPTMSVSTASTYEGIEYTVRASDGAAGLPATAYSFDGGVSWQASNTFTRGGLQPKHAYTLDIQVRDAVGNVATAATTASTLDDGTPHVTPVAFDGSRVPRALAPRLVRLYDVTTAHGTIDKVTASFLGRTVTITGGVLDLRQLPEGTSMLTVRATDSDGDVGSYSKRIRIDRTAPSIGVRVTGFALGPVLRLDVHDAGAGTTTPTYLARLPRQLGTTIVRARVSDRDGNATTRRVQVTRRLALGDQRLNFGLKLRTFDGARVDPTRDAVRASFRFLGTQPPWYVSSDLQTPFVAEAQWRLVRLGCLPRATATDGSLDLPTIRAVQRYQRARHLPVLGTIGPRTRAALDRDLLAGTHRC